MRWICTWMVSLLLIFTNGQSNLRKKRVCIIGAGPSGIASLKEVAEKLDMFEPIGFERSSDIGGQWIYSDNTDFDEHRLPVHSSIYKYLRTNIPKQVMACPDYRNFNGEDSSYVNHTTLLSYLRNYTDHFNLRQYIHFDTMVEKVIPLSNHNVTKWLVKIKKLNTNFSSKLICDGVMVCSGPYTKPSIPNILGIEKFPGRVLHSHIYRRPEDFTGQTVAILGASISGKDIAFELSKYANKIYLSHRHDKITTEMPSNVIQVMGIVAANTSNLILSDNTSITADSLILCTGFDHDVPFLDKRSGVEIRKKYLYPVYKQIVNIEHPTMGFIHFFPTIRPFCPKFASQAKYFVAHLQGKVDLPNHEKMFQEADDILENIKSSKSLDYWWYYLDSLAKAANFEPLPEFYKEGYRLWFSRMSCDPLHFREYNLRFKEDGSIEEVKA
ncbi:uncharacterized protein LOC131671947 [Phymastichus coffea]|uniref:uncharacterized protein LOC131671947 n=1 Tax=Phymastichus coffea TaxID=108790 RepID=UPI00273B4B08|nr:uncharacterized protein LOC131671947 [Phymastichus coffea]